MRLPAVSAPPPGIALERSGAVASYASIDIDSLPLHDSEALPGDATDVSGLIIVTKGKLARGQWLGQALRAQGVSAQVVHQVASEMRSHFNFRNSRPGDGYRLVQDLDGRLLEFRYRDRQESSLRLLPTYEGYRVVREPLLLVPRIRMLSGVIRTSLYRAVKDAGESSQLASDFADIFAWDVDFTRTVRAGDDFQILYEQLYRIDDDGDEIYVRPGQILAAHYSGAVGDFSLVYFDEHNTGNGSFFRPDGSAVERHFLIAPLKYDRISSNYSSSRRHPILKVTRPHHGIDYAAPEGTAIWSVADGTVIHRGWAGGFGNLVKVRHVNGYESYYAHLSRFGERLRVGQTVRQKEIIGYVGHTGLATGAHVCFRIAKDGRYVNPMKLRGPKPSPIAADNWARFAQVRDRLLGRLEVNTALVADEAL